MGSPLLGENLFRFMEAATPDNVRKTGMMEVMGAAWDKVIHNDISISPFIPAHTTIARNSALFNHHRAGRIPQNVWEFYHDDPDRLATYSREVLGLDDIPTTESYHKQLKDEYKGYRETYDKLYEQAGLGGKAAGLIGEGAAYLMDPVRAIGFVSGIGPTASLLRMMVVEGAIQAGAEGLAQAALYDWKKEMDDSYDPANALYEVIAAGAIGAGIPFAAKAVRLTVGQGKKVLNHYATKTAEGSQYVQNMIRTLDLYPEGADLQGVLKAEEAVIKNMENPPAPKPKPTPTAAQIKTKQTAVERQFQEDLNKTIGETPATDPATQVAPVEPTPDMTTSAKEVPATQGTPPQSVTQTSFQTERERLTGVTSEQYNKLNEFQQAAIDAEVSVKILEECI